MFMYHIVGTAALSLREEVYNEDADDGHVVFGL